MITALKIDEKQSLWTVVLDKKTWKKFGELGWLALPIPEDFGGLGGSTVDVAVLLEGFGRGLVVEPYQSAIILGAETITLAGRADQKQIATCGFGRR